jgi:hypothetical protein
MNLPPFESFQKIPRLSRDIVITEKIDGTNAQVCILEDGRILSGSRSRWITPQDDNFGFAAWVRDNQQELLKLGVGHHYGEWWGSGIQRRYGLSEKRFSLFNTARWSDDAVRPSCCHVVPVIYQGPFSTIAIDNCLQWFADNGSMAAPGFMNPEGIIIYHTASRQLYKKTIDKDEEPKGRVRQ